MLVFPRLDSTNTLALSLSGDPSQHGLVLLAEEQSAGRGQYGRSWQAPLRSSVLMSLLLFPPPALRRPALLVAWAAVSVCELVQAATGLAATIKWPNDVLIHGKKVCGILIEQRNSGNPVLPLATVVGLGLNVTQPAEAFAAANLPDAGSLLSMSGTLLARRIRPAAVRRIHNPGSTVAAATGAARPAGSRRMCPSRAVWPAARCAAVRARSGGRAGDRGSPGTGGRAPSRGSVKPRPGTKRERRGFTRTPWASRSRRREQPA